MGSVYYGWQLVFAYIIDDKTETYIDIVDWTGYIHVIIDIWLCSWPDWTSDFVTDCPYCFPFIFACYFSLITIYIFIICSYVICTCTFPFILTHSVGVLTPWICIFRSLHVILLIRYLERIIGNSRSPEFSLFDYPIWVLFLVFTVYWCWFSISSGLSLFYSFIYLLSLC